MTFMRRRGDTVNIHATLATSMQHQEASSPEDWPGAPGGT